MFPDLPRLTGGPGSIAVMADARKSGDSGENGKSKKNWKDHLLSSGVPLEYSVGRVFEKLGMWQPKEFRYERRDADGILKVFSVDVHTTDKDNFWVDSLVECKYRHDGTKWVFTPMEYEYFFGPNFCDLFVTLDQCCIDRKVNLEVLGKAGDRYPLCGKAIEILPDGANPKSIEQAVQQLRYAVVAKVASSIEHQVDELLGKPTPIFVIVPIIVTTAALWRLRDGTTLENVREAQDINEIADPHDTVILMQTPDNLDASHTAATLHGKFTGVRGAKLETLLKQTKDRTLSYFVDYFSQNVPSLFIIISYKKFQSSMTNLHNFFKQSSLIQPRTK
jgi:hypothetical protein